MRAIIGWRAPGRLANTTGTQLGREAPTIPRRCTPVCGELLISPESAIRHAQDGTMAVIPRSIVGLLVTIGGITVLTAGMPWQTKREADLREQLVDQRIDAVADKI
jgi:hypothetical protein